MKSWLVGVVAAFVTTSASATVSYSVDLRAPEHHTGIVTATFPVAPAPYLDVKMAAWRTGRYTILNLANGVSQFSATDSEGGPLAFQKIDKSTWRVRLSKPTAVHIRYELYANELGSRTRHIDDSHAFLDASAVFMYADKYRGDDVRVALNVPQAWHSFSGMTSPAPQQFVAPNWDVLVDSPIETGIEKVASFSEDGRSYTVTAWGDANLDLDRISTDLKRIVLQPASIWDSYPFQRYVFMIHATDNVGGATEHRNSTVIQFPRQLFGPPESYRQFLAIAEHEFIHTWNVKAYRNAAMVPYDYQKENYTDLLWLEEGSTEYFARPMLLQAGLMRPEDYFSYLGKLIDAERHRPGRLAQSVADASWDEWIAPSDPERAQNAWVDIYTQGAIASWMLDLALLERTGGKVSYRDVHEQLYKRFGSGSRGFTDGDVLGILGDLAGDSWDQWWTAHIKSPIDPDFGALLEPVGLELIYPDVPRAWAGWRGSKVEGGVKLDFVEKGSPAWDSGFNADDVLVTIDGEPLVADRFDMLAAEHKPGDTITVGLLRRGQVVQKALKLGVSRGSAKVRPVARPTPAQMAMFKRWLLIPYPAP